MQMIFALPVLVALLVLLLAWVGWRYFLGAGAQGQAHQLQASQRAEVVLSKPLLSMEEAVDLRTLPAGPVANTQAERPVVNHSFRWLLLPLLSLPLVGLGVLLVLNMGRYYQRPDYVAQGYAQAERIKQTLREEKLVPPPALPPAAFVDAQAERPSLDINHASRDWSRLNPAFVQTVLHVMAAMKERGFSMVLLEGYRSPERQNALAAQGNHVTQAKGGESKHQYGLAVDLAPIRNGKVVISERDPWAMQAYQALGEESQAAGLTWGGNWSFKDFGHIEQSGSIRALLAKK